ncbi:MAG TPA: hypothetical protein VFS05_11810, partial [Gemmatimonadaceae bacterium]|nr:hypothetical protein [Gemmatimonadaceae bacterium]
LLRPSSSATFDIVFDIDAAGKVVLYPVQRIGGVSGRTMFRFPDQPFDAITEAPTGGYTDTTATLDVGQTVLVRAEPTYCAGSLRTDIFSKIQVLSVDLPTRQIRFQSTVDPNCGFVSFLPGVPDR